MRTTSVSRRAVAAVSLLAGSPAFAQWSQDDGVYNLSRLGYVDAAHTHTNGTKYSAIGAVSASGAVFGASTRYNAGQVSGFWAQTAWMWTPAGALTRVGLTDAAYAGTNGYQYSAIWGASSDGSCVGTSHRYSGSLVTGTTTWVRSPDGAYSTLGLVEVENGGDGTQPLKSTPTAMNAAGQVIGIAQRAAPNDTANRAGWFWSAQTGTVRLGFFDATYTHAEGMQTTHLRGLTDSGVVIGQSLVFNGGSGVYATTAWVWSAQRGVATLGLVGPHFSSPDGVFYGHGPVAANNAGWVAGSTALYPSNSPFGSAAWVARPVEGGGYTTERIGLLNDPNDAGSLQDSSSTHISEEGWVGGQCAHISMASVHGRNTWVWTPEGGTERVGLTDVAHTRSNDGTQDGGIAFIGGGRAAGTSVRYVGIDERGFNAWLWRPGFGSVSLGLLDARHNASNGYQEHMPLAMDAAGNIIGTSRRFNSQQTDAGFSGWYYSAATGMVTPLVFSVNPSSQYASTQPRCFTPDGSVVGKYVDVVSNTEKAFIWRPGRGFADLNSRVDWGLAFSGWTNLADTYAQQPAGSGVIAGTGRITGAATPNNQVFAMTRVPGCGRADVGSPGGAAAADFVLDNNDFIAFISLFFAGDPRADLGRTGGLLGADGSLDNNDFVAFIDRFFTGC